MSSQNDNGSGCVLLIFLLAFVYIVVYLVSAAWHAGARP